MTTQPDARHVEEPKLPDEPKHESMCHIYWNGGLCNCRYYERVGNYAPSLRAIATALHAANRDLAEEVAKLKERLTNLYAAVVESGCATNGDRFVKNLRAEQAETRALAAQKDAGRYRILREQNEREHTTRDAECVINWNHGHDWAPVKDLDAAVDAIDATAK